MKRIRFSLLRANGNSGVVFPSPYSSFDSPTFEEGVRRQERGRLRLLSCIRRLSGLAFQSCRAANYRDCYARGALQAAKFLAAKPAGRYTMNDVLGL